MNELYIPILSHIVNTQPALPHLLGEGTYSTVQNRATLYLPYRGEGMEGEIVISSVSSFPYF
jgi:hypothetical protein